MKSDDKVRIWHVVLLAVTCLLAFASNSTQEKFSNTKPFGIPLALIFFYAALVVFLLAVILVLYEGCARIIAYAMRQRDKRQQRLQMEETEKAKAKGEIEKERTKIDASWNGFLRETDVILRCKGTMRPYRATNIVARLGGQLVQLENNLTPLLQSRHLETRNYVALQRSRIREWKQTLDYFLQDRYIHFYDVIGSENSLLKWVTEKAKGERLPAEHLLRLYREKEKVQTLSAEMESTYNALETHCDISILNSGLEADEIKRMQNRLKSIIHEEREKNASHKHLSNRWAGDERISQPESLACILPDGGEGIGDSEGSACFVDTQIKDLFIDVILPLVSKGD